MLEVISTRRYPLTERLDAWNELIGSTYKGMHVDAKSEQFQPRLGVWQYDDLRIVRPRSQAACITRHQRTALVASQQTYIVHLLTEGQVELEQRGRCSELERGDMVICAAEEYYRFNAIGTHEMLVVEFSEQQLAERFPRIDDFVARTISGKQPGPRILQRYLGALWQEARGAMPPRQGALHEQILLDLTIACLSAAPCQAPAPGGRLISQMQDMIAERLEDCEFGPALLAEDLGVPLRTLQSAAARAGLTLGQMINEARLEKACATLRNNPAMPVADVAFACGFADPSYFARRFIKTYGLSPSLYRQGH